MIRLLPPTGGYLFHQTFVQNEKAEKRAGAGIAYVPQGRYIFSSLTGRSGRGRSREKFFLVVSRFEGDA
ncbi:hypothetical protein SC22_03265 [Bacillus sp. A053]|uniref:hypothetical protein n=1 Tax=Bacillus stercoris TaxID=2054641 RepID=UPI00058A3B4A|nr:hypothetical protein CDO84_17875 [Bacillus sp. MD-5]AUS11787.1 hypothetical protein C0W65_06955 [Bacillus subtilis]KIH41053.1 hypothetical protein SC22_03265 [Bacillus sp. A053]MEC2112124.1 hypothetical protein [Bacillus stercoris]